MQEQAFLISDGVESKRVRLVKIRPDLVRRFVSASASISDRDLEYLPYKRFLLAAQLQEAVGEEFFPALLDLLLDRKFGGFLIDLSTDISDADTILRLSIAIAHGIGVPHDDVLSGKFYGRLMVKGGDIPAERSNLYQPYSTFGLHTDGAASPTSTTDWIIFAKTLERNAVGGQTRVLHLDDWEAQRRFVENPLSARPFKTALPSANDPRQQQWGNHVASRELNRPIFFSWNDAICIRFADQFIHPRNVEEAVYLGELVDSFENSQGVDRVTLPVGSIIALNNNYFLHGRTVFERHERLEREIIRMRGSINAPVNGPEALHA